LQRLDDPNTATARKATLAGASRSDLGGIAGRRRVAGSSVEQIFDLTLCTSWACGMQEGVWTRDHRRDERPPPMPASWRTLPSRGGGPRTTSWD